MVKLLEVSKAGHGECFDTTVREALYVRLGCPPEHGYCPLDGDDKQVKAWLLNEYGEGDRDGEL